MADHCSYPRCQSRAIEIIYFGRDLCACCWKRVCGLSDAGEFPRIAALLKLGRRCVVSDSGIVLRGS